MKVSAEKLSQVEALLLEHDALTKEAREIEERSRKVEYRRNEIKRTLLPVCLDNAQEAVVVSGNRVFVLSTSYGGYHITLMELVEVGDA